MVEKMEMESTADFVKRMEAKLNNKSNTKKELNSKDMLQSINEYREVFMRDAFKNNIPLNDNVKNGSDVVSVSYLKKRILPEHEISLEEKQVLVENDSLAIENDKLE